MKAFCLWFSELASLTSALSQISGLTSFPEGHRNLPATNCNLVMQNHTTEALEILPSICSARHLFVGTNEVLIFNPVPPPRWCWRDEELVFNQKPIVHSFCTPALSCPGSLEPMQGVSTPWMGFRPVSAEVSEVSEAGHTPDRPLVQLGDT